MKRGADRGKTHSITRTEVVLAVETSISSCPVATGPNFAVKKRDQKYFVQSCVFHNFLQVDIIIAADRKEQSLVFLMILLLSHCYVQDDNTVLYALLMQHLPVTLRNNLGGLSHGKVQPKTVTHYANSNAEQCFVFLYILLIVPD